MNYTLKLFISTVLLPLKGEKNSCLFPLISRYIIYRFALQGDLGYIGCSTDVLDIVNTKCSGRRSCEISVPNTEFEETKPCYQELKMYFETSFRCLKGMI